MKKLIEFYNRWKAFIRVDLLMYLVMIVLIVVLLTFFS